MIGRPVRDPRTGRPGKGVRKHPPRVDATVSEALRCYGNGSTPATTGAPVHGGDRAHPRADDGGAGIEPLVLFRTLAHNPQILDKLRSTGSYLLNFGTIDPLEREVVILRTCARCGSEYEWGVHVTVYARAVGLSDEQIAATVLGRPDDHAWSKRQALLVELVDQLHDGHRIEDALWEQLSATWGPAQLVELVSLVGQYHAVSFLTNSFGLAPEAFAARFP
jgi:alkylhydroperoxidase family enzyme